MAYILIIYSIYEFLKFLFLATLGDIITTFKRDLWIFAKSVIALIIACILF